jgi:nucleoside-diphosphate-sugar epimerase
MRVAILGCGYVGLALGRRLREAGHDVVGVRRSRLAAVEAAGLDPVRADVTDRSSLAAVPEVDAVVFSASAGGRTAERARETYLKGLETVVAEFGGRSSPPDRLVYTGSTGVYGDHDGAWVDETTPPAPGSERGRVLLDAESVVLSADALVGTVVRFAGLYGPERYRLDRYLSGSVSPGWLNLVHRADAAGAVAHLLAGDHARGDVVLAVDDEPVDRYDLATWLAEQCGVDPPERGSPDPDRPQKRCSNERLRATGYEFTHPTFRQGYREAVDRRLAAGG